MKNQKEKIVRVITGNPIELQVTFERENEAHELEATGLVMYNYITKCFMAMDHKIHGKFFADMIEAEKQAILAEDRAKIAEHYANYIARELTGNY